MDELLITHGAYIPVELLIALGRLSYADYDDWRCGERPSLQSALAGNPRRVLELLESAAQWAARLGLHPEPCEYFGWGANAGTRLTFLDDEHRASEALLATHCVRRKAEAAEGDQFDLFLDGGSTAALADLRAALRGRDVHGARRALDALAAREPAHPLRPAAERLTDALVYLAAPLPAASAESELLAIEQSLLPAARDVLGPDARDLLAPFWRRLGDALAGAPFDPERPQLHASHAYAHALDWPRTVAAIEAVPDHADEPVLLERLALARLRAGDRNGAIAALSQLCWRAPQKATECLEQGRIGDFTVRQAWFAFIELDAEPDATFFPAYQLVAEPGLVRSLPETFAGGERVSVGEQAFSAVRALLCGDTAETRRAVRAAAPWLLEVYHEVRGNRIRRP